MAVVAAVVLWGALDEPPQGIATAAIYAVLQCSVNEMLLAGSNRKP